MPYFTVAAADQIDASGIPANLTRQETLDLANEAAQAVESAKHLVPSGCAIAIVTGDVELTMGANPRTFTPEELDGLIFNLQVARTQV